MQGKEKKQSFLEGALFLTAGVLAVKLIGALYKVPLSAVIGEEGMGYFSTAYSLYNVLFSLSTAGLPVAVARAVSEADAQKNAALVLKLRRTAVPLFFLTGLSGFAVLLLGAPLFTRAVNNPGALPALVALAPSVLLCSMAAAYKGYFEGKRNMVPTAVSQVIEAFLKLIVGLFAAVCVMEAAEKIFPENRTPYAAAAAILGVTVGSLFSVVYLAARCRKAEHSLKAPVFGVGERKTLSKKLIRVALPVSAGAVAVSVSGLIDASLLQTRLMHVLQTEPKPLLSAYRSAIPADLLENPEALPNYLFGCYNMALTLFMLVPGITQAFSVSALPNVSAAFTGGDRRALQSTVSSVLRLTLLFALPAGLGLSVLAEPVTKLLYGERLSTPVISGVLSVLGLAAVFSALTAPLSSILQAVGKVGLSVKITLSGLVLKVILNYILVGLPRVHLLGGALSTLLSTAFTAVCLYTALCRVLNTRMPFGRMSAFFGTLFSSVLCVLAALSADRVLRYLGFAGRLSTLPCIVFAVLFYAASVILTGAVTAEDAAAVGSRQKLKKISKNL